MKKQRTTDQKAQAREAAKAAAIERGDLDLIGDEFTEEIRRIDGLPPSIDFSDRGQAEVALRRSLAPTLSGDDLDRAVDRSMAVLFPPDEG